MLLLEFVFFLYCHSSSFVFTCFSMLIHDVVHTQICLRLLLVAYCCFLNFGKLYYLRSFLPYSPRSLVRVLFGPLMATSTVFFILFHDILIALMICIAICMMVQLLLFKQLKALFGGHSLPPGPISTDQKKAKSSALNCIPNIVGVGARPLGKLVDDGCAWMYEAMRFTEPTAWDHWTRMPCSSHLAQAHMLPPWTLTHE